MTDHGPASVTVTPLSPSHGAFSKKMKSTPFRFACLFTGVAFICFSLFALFLFFEHQRKLEAVFLSRYEILGNHIAKVLSQSCHMGLSIKDTPLPQNLMQTIRSKDKYIKNMTIFTHNQRTSLLNRRGSLLFSTDLNDHDAPIPIQWLEHVYEEKPWHTTYKNFLSVGVNFTNPLNESIGAVVIQWDPHIFSVYTKSFIGFLVLFVLGLTGASFFLMHTLAKILCRPLLKSLQRMEKALDDATSTKTFTPFIATNYLEECFYKAYRRIKSLFELLDMIHTNIPSEKRIIRKSILPHPMSSNVVECPDVKAQRAS